MFYGSLSCCGIKFPNLGSLASHEVRSHGTQQIVPKGIKRRTRYPLRFKAAVLEKLESWLAFVCTRCELSQTPELLEQFHNERELAKQYECAEQEEEMEEEGAEATRRQAQAMGEAFECTGCGNRKFKRKFTTAEQVISLSLCLILARSLADLLYLSFFFSLARSLAKYSQSGCSCLRDFLVKFEQVEEEERGVP